jgi:hypothetical protein
MISPAMYAARYSNGMNDRTAGYVPVFGQEKTATAVSSSTPPSTPENSATSFLDIVKGVLDVINPLQHIPVIGALYRHLTGDEISSMARVAGDALYGGPIGAAIGMADVVLQKTTGNDIGETAIALATGSKRSPASDPVLALNDLKNTQIIWDTPPVPAQSVMADASPKSVPPELVAAKMMEALNKYEVMKQAGLAPAPSIVNAAF